MISNRILRLAFLATVLLIPASIRSQWIQATKPDCGNIHCFAVLDNDIFAGTDSGVFMSKDRCDSWTAENNGLYDSDILSLAFAKSDLLASTANGRIFLTIHLGASWTNVYDDSNHCTITALAADPTTAEFVYPPVYAGFSDGRILRSLDMGFTWTAISAGLPKCSVTGLAVNCNRLFAAFDTAGVYASSDSGETWKSLCLDLHNGLPNAARVTVLAANDSAVFAGTKSGDSTIWSTLYSYFFADSAWSGFFFSAKGEWTIRCTGQLVFIGITDGVWYSPNWGRQGEDNPLYPLYRPNYAQTGAIAVSDSILFVYYNKGIWKRSISELQYLGAIRSFEPARCELLSIFPNPFNPITTIDFSITRRDHVSLKIFDLLGRETATLVNKQLETGHHSIHWDASNFPSGIYFCRLEAGKNIAIQKMVFIK